MFGDWVEETNQSRRRKLQPPLYYVGVGCLLASAVLLGLILCSLVMALTGH